MDHGCLSCIPLQFPVDSKKKEEGYCHFSVEDKMASVITCHINSIYRQTGYGGQQPLIVYVVGSW